MGFGVFISCMRQMNSNCAKVPSNALMIRIKNRLFRRTKAHEYFASKRLEHYDNSIRHVLGFVDPLR